MSNGYVGSAGALPSKERNNQSQGRAAGAINKRRGPCGSAPGNSTKSGGINRALSPTKQK